MKVGKILFIILTFAVFLFGCAEQNVKIEEPPAMQRTATLTQAPTTTDTPTPLPSHTPTMTNTITSQPEYSVLGEELNGYVEGLGWEVILCDENVQEEDLDNGIFLYRIDTQAYFCDLAGFSEEPVPIPEPGETQSFLAFLKNWDTEGSYTFRFYGVDDKYYPYPSLFNVDPDITAEMSDISEFVVRIWPLTEEEVNQYFESLND